MDEKQIRELEIAAAKVMGWTVGRTGHRYWLLEPNFSPGDYALGFDKEEDAWAALPRFSDDYRAPLEWLTKEIGVVELWHDTRFEKFYCGEWSEVGVLPEDKYSKTQGIAVLNVIIALQDAG